MRSFVRVASVLAGILALAVVLLILGRVDTVAKPSADFYGPSGVSAFADLLRKRGFAVRSDRTVDPKLSADELVVAIELRKPTVSLAMDDPEPQRVSSDVDELETRLNKFIENGGRVFNAQVSQDFQSSASAAVSAPIEPVDEQGNPRRDVQPMTISLQLLDAPHMRAWGEEVSTWQRAKTDVVWAHAAGRGVAFVLADAIGMTNRFIDQYENARFMTSMVEALAPAKKVVFLEAVHGDVVKPGLLESIGLWLKYGWTQLMLVALVIGYTIGKRFGLPKNDAFVQRGQRDLVDAVASLYQRSRADETAIGSVLRNADRDIRKSLKLSFDAPVTQRNDQIPDALRLAIEHAERVASIPDSPEGQVLSAARRVEAEVAEFIASRTIIRPKAKRKAA